MPQPAPPILLDLPEAVAERRGVRLRLLRDDLLHPELPGNKWRKLKYNLLEARHLGHSTLLTFGGAYSNHLAAVAAAGRLQGFGTIGVVRGEAAPELSPTLQQCQADGMRLHFISREAYRQRHDAAWVAELVAHLGPAYVVPEGGTNTLALRGCAELVTELDAAQEAFDTLALACGTGGTLAGLLVGLGGQRKALGVAALKGADFLRDDVNNLTQVAVGEEFSNWHLHTTAHFGGYAKYSEPLLAFIHSFYQRHHVVLDPVYTGKLLYGVLQLIEEGYFAAGSTVVAVHTGGLQGWAGFQQRFGVRAPGSV
ncbi:1-aminocyclopropane-1-carboxylate deaminase/D-cysteine desulfhydrase [Hymenobacter latericus]|uniref:1-aminocyclopropane-1-carboxylate deaminase/D-cysteine desulfhydrase n=1 Tax=Hymenobacter sp. YIM 151858-1 TaxID=2987688 RepID=UPI002227D86D|nr:pyridoxal-phosphate dependent enzyme [Hymenobacter sp. YIM 151858-1]UYZ58683.1 pyridoxal-phosphate dependent enzyme [Hymenobacter sp. YIM 151858-1]